MDKGAWWATVHTVTESDITECAYTFGQNPAVTVMGTPGFSPVVSRLVRKDPVLSVRPWSGSQGFPRWTCSHFQGPLSWSKGNP